MIHASAALLEKDSSPAKSSEDSQSQEPLSRGENTARKRAQGAESPHLRMKDEPETPRQARRWDDAYSRYLRAGLCSKCASQSAWAGQYGYDRAAPPCAECIPAMQSFPGADHVNGWKSIPERRAHWH